MGTLLRGGWGQTKPPAGTPLAEGHPFGAQLTFFAPFNEQGGRPVDLALGQVVTPVNGPSWRPDGIAVASASSQYLTAPYNARFGQAYLSVAAWINFPSDASYRQILDRDYNPSGSRCFQFRKSSTDFLELIVFNAASLTTATSARTIAGSRHYVVGTYDGATVRVYVDGVLSGSSALAGALRAGTIDLQIGRNAESAQYANGTIDMPAMLARALRPSEIAALYADPYQMFAAPAWRRYWLPGAPGGATVQSRTSTMAVTATFTPAQLAVRARTVAAPAGGTFTPASLALRARTLAATAGGTLVGTDLALRARTLAATAGGTLTATGTGIAAGIQARTAALAITATVTTGQLAVRARTLTAPVGGLLTAVGGLPGAVSARTLTVLVQAALTVTGVGRRALRGITQRRAGTPGPDSHRGGTSSGGKRWTL